MCNKHLIMKSVFFLVFIVLSTSCFFSQDYDYVLGIKSGYPGFFGLNVKKYKGRYFAFDNTLKSSFDFDNHFVGINSLLEFNKEFGFNDGYSWYIGAGPELYYYLKGGYLDDVGSVSHKGLFGRFDGVFGLEFLSPKTDLNVALDVGPSVILYPIIKFTPIFNVSVRYAFRSNKYIEFKQIEPVEKKKSEL